MAETDAVTVTQTRQAHDGTAPAGPLTTVFTPTGSCTLTESLYWWSTCMPPRWNLYDGAASYYSPGVCPSGMESAATPPTGFGPPVESTEAAIVCCPSSYSFADYSSYFYCESEYETSTTDYGYFYDSSIGDYSTTSTSSYLTTTTRTRYAVQVRWAAADTPNLPSGAYPSWSFAAANVASTTADASASGTADSTSSASSTSSSKPHKGLSAGAAAGIGVSVGLVIIALMGLGLFLFMRRSKQKQQQQTANQGNSGMSPQDPAAYSAMMPVVVTPTQGGDMQSMYQVSGYAPQQMPTMHSQNGMLTTDDQLRRIQERKSRLMEIQRLEEEEMRLTSQYQGQEIDRNWHQHQQQQQQYPHQLQPQPQAQPHHSPPM